MSDYDTGGYKSQSLCALTAIKEDERQEEEEEENDREEKKGEEKKENNDSMTSHITTINGN